MNELQFIEALKDKGFSIDKKQRLQFQKYFKELIEWNKKMNLTAITDEESVYLKHFYDSISIAFDFPFDKQSIIDIGAGAGFPSIPLKILFPNLQVTIVDSLTKRITFLKHLFAVLELDNCYAISARAEEYVVEHRESYDIAMARAVAKLSILDELCLPLVKPNGYFLALKGRKAKEEWQEASKGITILGGKLDKESTFTLSDQEEYRTNFIIKKVKNTPNKYPRAFSQIKKKPL